MTPEKNGYEELKRSLDSKTRERLTHPVVLELYQAYVNYGTPDSLVEIVSMVPQDNQDPIIHTLTSHVTKEKPVFLYILGKALCDESSKKPVLVAASVDLLWSLSLIYDDIYDKDLKRAGKSAAWVEFGKELAFTSAHKGFEAVLKTITVNLGKEAAETTHHYVYRGVNSLDDHQKIGLDSTADSIMANYIERAHFHTTLPISLMSTTDTNPLTSKSALEAIIKVNLAGQILNDIKDLSPEFTWIRQGLSDICSGVVTLPLALLWRELTDKERQEFISLFGSGDLDQTQRAYINNLILKTKTIQRTCSIVEQYYQASLDAFREVLSPDDIIFPTNWIEYKREQMRQLVTSCQ